MIAVCDIPGWGILRSSHRTELGRVFVGASSRWVGQISVRRPQFANSRCNLVEALFAELKNQIGLRRLRRMKFVRGSYSADPPYTILEVLGILLSDRIKAELSQYGFNEFHPDSVGFHAVRPVPPE